MDKEASTLREQLKALYPASGSDPVDARPKRRFLDPKTVLSVDVTDDYSVTVLKASDASYVTSEAQLYHLVATMLTKEGTDSLWFARTPARSARGDLWVLHNPRALQVLVDPLSSCRSSAYEFNTKGKLVLYCFPSRREYYAERQDASGETRVQPSVASTPDEQPQQGE